MSEQEIAKSDHSSSGVRCDAKDSNDDSSINDDSIATLSDRDESDNSDFMDTDDAFSVCRDMVSEVANQSDALQTESYDFDNLKHELSELFPNDFINVYKTLNEPKTMGGIVSLTDSDSGEEFDDENSNEPKCMVPSCTSRKRVKARSRLVTSYFGLSYMESPVVCHKCFIKAIAFYKKIAKITPSSMKFLVNDNFTKGPDCIDICDDGPLPQVSPKMLEDNSLATEVARNIQPYVKKVAEEYNVDEKFNKVISKMEAKIGKMTIWINELNCKLDMDDQDMVSKLQQVYHSYEPQLKMSGEIDLGTVDADNPELSKRWDERELLPSGHGSDQSEKQSSTIVIDGTTDDPDIAIVEDTVVSNLKKPSTLPPRGMIVRKKPSVSEKMFVSRIGESNDWVMATVESVLMHEDASKVFTYKYKVKMLVNPAEIYVKEVSEEEMAYYEPSPVRIPVGNRVISALYTKDENDEPKYYPGVVAECPSSNNQYRYLIFFDSMAVQYSNHEDVRITCKMKEHIYEYFPFNSRFFIKKYFEMLPKRKILTLNTMDVIKVEHNGHWVDAKVTAVDGLLMEVFYKQKEPTEWLYRGSPRVMYKEIYRNRLLKTLAENPNGQVSRYGVVAEDDPEEVALVRMKLRSKRQLDQQDQLQQQNTKVRAVARKTITRVPEEPSAQSQRSASKSSYQNRNSGKDEFAGYIKVNKDLGANSLIPRDLGASHECSELCITWTNKTLDTCRGKNPLVIPMLFAFKRVDVMPMGGAARQIYYESPCGRRLEDFDQLLSYLQKTNCQLSVDYFNFDPWVSVWEEFKAATEGLLLKDLSYGKEFSPIPVVNTVDHDLPPFMNYMVMRKATEGVPLNLDTEFLTGCDCEDDCSNKSSCPCWQKTIKDYLDLIVTSNAEIDDSINLMDYSNIGYQNKRLVEYVSSGIYECNSTCKCSHTCLNRVVQLPLKVKLELFKTKHKGWGTRCLNDIPAGGFICVYVGNILTEKAANEDGKAYGDEYFAELDYIEVMERMMNKPGYESGPSDPENTDDEDGAPPEGKEMPRDTRLRSQKKEDNKKTRLKRSTTDQARMRQHSGDNLPPATKPADKQSAADALNSSNSYIPLRLCYSNLYGAKESVYIIDAKTAGNIGRYFNHSCEPNIFVQNVFVDTHDLRFPWVAFFAKHHIRAGSELTWDYQYMVDSVPGKRLYCYCGSRNCRGRLL